MPIDAFMLGVKRTALRPGELLAAVTLRLLDGWQGYAKVGVRNAMVIAIAGACLAVDEPGRSVRLALGSVAPTIVRAAEAEACAAEAVDWNARAGRGRGRRRVRSPRCRGEQPDRRPPLDGGLSTPLDRGPRRAAARAAPSPVTGAEGWRRRERALPVARQRPRPRRRRRMARREPALRVARAPRPVRLEGSVRAGRVRVVQRARRRRAGLLVPRARRQRRRDAGGDDRGHRRRRRFGRTDRCAAARSSRPAPCSAGSARPGW